MREANPDEAVVEEHAHESGAIAGVSADGGADDGADELLRPRATAVVVPNL
jgi:hypothetical protein